jgi:hypothetical protein
VAQLALISLQNLRESGKKQQNLRTGSEVSGKTPWGPIVSPEGSCSEFDLQFKTDLIMPEALKPLHIVIHI